MDADWNFKTIWLYDDPVNALVHVPVPLRNSRECMVCLHVEDPSNLPVPSDWKVGYSCLSSMDVHVIGYCEKHYGYLKSLMDRGDVRCHCGEEGGIVHNFEEIIPVKL